MVSVLIDHDTKRWKADLVKRAFLPFEANTILSIPLSYSLLEDKLIWKGNRRGEFTVRSAYYVALPIVETIQEGESSGGDPQTQLWKKVWHLNLPTKIRIFAWLACMNALPTMPNLRIRGVCTEAKCLICDQCIETFNREDAEAICKIPLSYRHVTDVVVWLHNKDGVYTVRSGYHVARKVLREWAESSTSSGQQIWKKLWKVRVPNKMKVFA